MALVRVVPDLPAVIEPTDKLSESMFDPTQIYLDDKGKRYREIQHTNAKGLKTI